MFDIFINTKKLKYKFNIIVSLVASAENVLKNSFTLKADEVKRNEKPSLITLTTNKIRLTDFQAFSLEVGNFQ